jgi:hypothetical protein
MRTLATTIKREFLAAIVARTKKIEYREIKPYWTLKFSGIMLPFKLRMINGMTKNAPEVTVLINKITIDGPQGKDYELHIRKVLDVKNWPLKHTS